MLMRHASESGPSYGQNLQEYFNAASIREILFKDGVTRNLLVYWEGVPQEGSNEFHCGEGFGFVVLRRVWNDAGA
jgi:hypothetical protein